MGIASFYISHRLQLSDTLPTLPSPFAERIDSLLSKPLARIPVVGFMAALGGVNGTVCNAQQYDESQALRLHNYSGPSISCLTHGESIGLAVSVLPYRSSSRAHPICS